MLFNQAGAEILEYLITARTTQGDSAKIYRNLSSWFSWKRVVEKSNLWIIESMYRYPKNLIWKLLISTTILTEKIDLLVHKFFVNQNQSKDN